MLPTKPEHLSGGTITIGENDYEYRRLHREGETVATIEIEHKPVSREIIDELLLQMARLGFSVTFSPDDWTKWPPTIDFVLRPAK